MSLFRTATPVVLAAALAGCVAVGSAPQALRQAGLRAMGNTLPPTIEKAQVSTFLSTLTGNTPYALGLSIPERGTVAGRAATKRYLSETLTGFGYQVETHAYRANGQNLIARMPVAKAGAPWIVVGAHLDSVRNAGANDNGTGSACVLEMARSLKDMPGRQVNVMFCWFDEEELGLVGSYALAKKFKAEKLPVASVHTIDMMGWDKDKDQAVEIEQPDAGLWEYYQQVNTRYNLGLKLVRTSSGSTDHVAFRETGFPAVGLCEEWAGGDTTPHYHRKSDTFETIDLDYLTSSTRLFASAITDLARAVPAPKSGPFIPHKNFPGRDHCPPGGHTDHDHAL